MREKKKKAVIAMSGGVDSSAAAFLLQKQGYDVMGMFMRLGVVGLQENEAMARRVCQKLNIKFYPINFIAKFKKEIIDYFVDSYAQGLTPNPCVKCNQIIKFGSLLAQAKKIGADYLATGHYSRNVERITHNAKLVYKLFCGKDENKDQSYFLYNLTQEQLACVLFPLGDYTKTQVKKITDKAGLPYLKKESQDVCFLAGDHNDFLKKYLNLKSGPIIALTPNPSPATQLRERGAKEFISPLSRDNRSGRGVGGEGRVIGEHQGLPLYTIGQRRGVEIGGIGPFYVARCDYKTNTLYVVKDGDDPALYSDKLIAENVNWIVGIEPKLPLQCEAVIRYRHKPVECKVTELKAESYKVESCDKNKYLVVFTKPQRAITPGQSVVFYQGDEVLGGGIIIA